jgi:ribosomal protein S18 acetylase RimI-like enzyme
MLTLQTPPGTIRSFDLAGDGEVVANLIEEAFALKNDPDGQFVLIQMRENARRLKQASWVPLIGPALGFVWEVDGRLVGNISVMPYTHNASRLHLIANVAVDPAFRGQGIAKALIARALRFSRQNGVREVWLQVKRDNEIAIRTYQQFGFQKGHCLDIWKKSGSQKTNQTQHYHYPSLYDVRKREFGDWQSQKEWLRLNYPPAMRWYSALDFGNLSPWAWVNPLKWVNLIELSQYSLCVGEELAAVLSFQRTALRSDNLYIAAPQTSAESEHVGVLLSRFLQENWAGKPLVVEYPTGRAAAGFESSGFTLARTLLWMHASL